MTDRFHEKRIVNGCEEHGRMQDVDLPRFDESVDCDLAGLHSRLLDLRVRLEVCSTCELSQSLSTMEKNRDEDVSGRAMSMMSKMGPDIQSSQALQRQFSAWTAKPAIRGPRHCSN